MADAILKARADCLLSFLLYNKAPISARGLHKLLEIRQPYPLWLSLRVTGVSIYTQPEDYCFVQREDGRDCDLSPTVALIAAVGGGSKIATSMQVAYCGLLANHVFKGRDVLEVFETGIKCCEAEALLTRSFDPERIPGGAA